MEYRNFNSDFIIKITSICKEIIKLKSSNINNTFNIFTEISDIYWRENFHSNILKIILDPNTPDISNNNPKYLNLLIKTIFVNDNIAFSNYTKVTIEEPTDDGRIDIFIKDLSNNNVIIIENKINNASDMPNQLARYYEYIKKSGDNLIAILYLPLYDKKPPFDFYEKKYDNIIKNVKDITYTIPVINLCEWLDKCLNLTDKENEIARVFIMQYSNLLKSLGGDKMVIQKQIEIIEEAFKNEDNKKEFYELGKIWVRRAEIVGNAIFDELKNIGFEINQGIATKEVLNDIFCVFKVYYDNFILGISFKNIISNNVKNTIKEIILNSVKNTIYFSDNIKEWDIKKDYKCSYIEFNLDQNSKTVNDIIILIKELYQYFKNSLSNKINIGELL